MAQPGICKLLESLVDSSTYGNPENPLRWTTKSTRKLADELKQQGFKIENRSVAYLLKKLGYSLQQNQKMNQVGEPHPDRDEQFRHISDIST